MKKFAHGFYCWWEPEYVERQGQLAFVERNGCEQKVYYCTEEEKDKIVGKMYYVENVDSEMGYIRKLCLRRIWCGVEPSVPFQETLEFYPGILKVQRRKLTRLNILVEESYASAKLRRENELDINILLTWFSAYGIELEYGADLYQIAYRKPTDPVSLSEMVM